jgi:hypothetical protein
MVAGCADSHFAASNASASAQATSDNSRPQRSPPVQVGYGLSSDGPTTDLYTELFGSKSRDDRDAPTAASSAAVAQSQPTTASSAALPQGKPATRTSAAVPQPQGQPANPAIAVQAQPATPQAEPATATVFGMSSNGPTTDLYTELFGGRSRE